MIGAALLSLVVLATLGGFFLGWPLAIAYRLHSGQPTPFAPRENEPWTFGDVVREGLHRFRTGRFLSWTPRRHVPWMWFDMAIVGLPVLALIVLPLVAGKLDEKSAVPAMKSAQYQVVVLMDTTLKLGFMLLATVYLVVRAGARACDFGLAWRNFGRNVAVGIIAFPMIAIPVYALQAALVYFGKWAYEHPLIDMLQKSPDFKLYVLLVFSACIIAPLSEEWFFRVVFQGWLERAFAWVKRKLDVERPPPVVQKSDSAIVAIAIDANPQEAFATAERTPLDADLNPYMVPPHLPLSAPAPIADEAREEPIHYILVHWVPILLSSFLFGLAHFGHGPAPITLSVLALALGYVYQRTHSIVPVIVIHSLFNSVSMLLFYVTMFERHLPLP